MIPRIIHFCWYGQSDIPDKAVDCLKSWSVLKDFSFRFWSDDEFIQVL